MSSSNETWAKEAAAATDAAHEWKLEAGKGIVRVCNVCTALQPGRCAFPYCN